MMDDYWYCQFLNSDLVKNHPKLRNETWLLQRSIYLRSGAPLGAPSREVHDGIHACMGNDIITSISLFDEVPLRESPYFWAIDSRESQRNYWK